MKASAQKMLDLSEKFNLPMALEIDAESIPILQKGMTSHSQIRLDINKLELGKTFVITQQRTYF
jgi:hypothetical protein